MSGDRDRLDQLVAEVDQRYYGKYRGTVTHNVDPDGRGRLRLQVPSVLGSAPTGWAEPCVPMGGLAGQGMIMLPDVGAHVWVEFEEGLIDRPLWVGTYWPDGLKAPRATETTETTENGESPAEPGVRLIRTPAGHRITLDDTAKGERVCIQHKAGARLELAADGACILEVGSGAKLQLRKEGTKIQLDDGGGNAISFGASGVVLQDSNGNRIVLGASGVTIEAPTIALEARAVALGGSGGEPLVRGSSWAQLFAAHVHPVPNGVSGPPATAGMAPQTVSLAVTTK